ncbi:MAG: hypothetical protein KDB65_00915 [Calditrichaeota bacterium]|nr:hypothetical protein [Calditrichota bacterium]MCB9369222.1 hypothetical protein [Calditrichota bacterium]
MKKFAIGLLALMFVLASSAFATIRYVSSTGAGSYTTVGAAAAVAASGDTILIGPGTYAEGNINQPSKRLIYIGAGWDQSMINLSSIWYANGPGQTGSSWEGLRIDSPTQMLNFINGTDSITVRRCLLAHSPSSSAAIDNNSGRTLVVEDCIFLSNLTTASSGAIIVSTSNYPATIRNCVFVNRGGNANCRAIWGGAASGTVENYNCVFLNFRAPYALNAAGGPLIAVNNVYYDFLATPSFGSYNASSVFDYNSSESVVAAPGTNTTSITTNPFVNYNTTNNFEEGITDLHLDPVNGASLINSGHPSLLDFTDGSQSDRGAYGGPKPLVDNGVPNYPWAVNIALNPNLVGVGTPVNATAIGRVGPQY